MSALAVLAHAFGGAFLFNTIPHLVTGMTGSAFPTPFAKPPGKGLSAPVVNVLWGFINLVIAYGLLRGVGRFDIAAWRDVAPVALGGLLVALLAAKQFGRLNPIDRSGKKLP